MAVVEVRLDVGTKVKLATFLGHRRVDPYSSQLLQMLILLVVPNDVNCSVSAREAVLDERQTYAILFLRAVEERAIAELR